MIDVVGMGADGWLGLGASARELVLGARVLLGGSRHLESVPPVPGQARRTWPAPLRAGLPTVLAEIGSEGVVVLASGDPLRSGIGTTLVSMLGADAVRIHPALSSDTLARARMGWSAEDTEVVTLVGRPMDGLRRHLCPGARIIALCSDGSTPAAIAAVCVAEGVGASRLTAWWRLGGPDEGHRSGPAATWGAEPTPNLVVVAIEVDPVGARGRPGVGPVPGRAEEDFEHDGQITKADMRASALARLRPTPGGLLWDLGSGSGSVAIEWALSCPNARAVAVERDSVRAERITANAARHGVGHEVRVLTEANDAAITQLCDVAELDNPDAVFVGGGLTEDTLRAAWARLAPGGRFVAHAVTLETEAVLHAAYRRFGGRLTRLVVEHASPLGGYLSWTPARPVVQWSATKPPTTQADTQEQQ